MFVIFWKMMDWGRSKRYTKMESCVGLPNVDSMCNVPHAVVLM